MSLHGLAAGLFLVLLIAWAVYEFGWGGGNPNDSHHNPPQGGL